MAGKEGMVAGDRGVRGKLGGVEVREKHGASS